MNQKTAKLIRRFIRNGNPDKNETELRELTRKFYTRYKSMNTEERTDFKKRVN